MDGRTISYPAKPLLDFEGAFYGRRRFVEDGQDTITRRFDDLSGLIAGDDLGQQRVVLHAQPLKGVLIPPLGHLLLERGRAFHIREEDDPDASGLCRNRGLGGIGHEHRRLLLAFLRAFLRAGRLHGRVIGLCYYVVVWLP
jgi:hypothetical protein